MFTRLGVYIRVPDVDVDRFAESMRSGAGLLGYIDQLSGGSISKVGVFSLGVLPPPPPPPPPLPPFLRAACLRPCPGWQPAHTPGEGLKSG